MNSNKRKAPFTKGVNLTMWLEQRRVEDIFRGMFTIRDLENIKGMGCDVVRVPIHFERFCAAEDGWRIPQAIFDITDDLAAWAEQLKMYVIFDFHNRTDIDSVTSEDVESILIPVWRQMAERYKDAAEYLIFELMNEPHGIAIPVWNGIISKVHRDVREIDTKHYIVAGGADWNSLAGMKALPDFGDDKIIYTFHFYDPHTFTHQGATWCRMERVRGLPFPYDAARMPQPPEDANEMELARYENYPQEGTVERIKQLFDEYERFSAERNAPIFCGEFGAHAFGSNREDRVRWYEIVTDLLEQRGIARTSWDYYGGFGLFRPDPELWRNHKLPRFPEDLDPDIVRALKLTV